MSHPGEMPSAPKSPSAASSRGFKFVHVALTGPSPSLYELGLAVFQSLHLWQLQLPQELPPCHALMLDFVLVLVAEPWPVALHPSGGGTGVCAMVGAG